MGRKGGSSANVVVVKGIIRVRVGVVVSAIALAPGGGNGRQNTLSRSALGKSVRNRPVGGVERIGQWTGVALIEEEVGSVYHIVLIVGLIGHGLENVGIAIPAAEGWKIPIHRDGRDARVVVIEGVVSRIAKRLRDSTAEKQSVDDVAGRVGFILIKGENDESVVHEVRVVEQRGQPVAGPGASNGDRGVVTIVGHVGGDEHPLRECLRGKIRVEFGEVLDEGEAGGIRVDRAEADEGIVLADVVVGICDLV